MKNEYAGSILAVRKVEDTIRATRKYTEGVLTQRAKHPIQGENFPSRVLVKYYEVYPDLDLEQVKPFWDVLKESGDWLWGATPHADVTFKYNYLRGKAAVTIYGGSGVTELLCSGVPGFGDALKMTKDDEPRQKGGS